MKDEYILTAESVTEVCVSVLDTCLNSAPTSLADVCGR